ncbi:DUF4241 domain-containing protein [Nannocystis pusilla]|uniref:DUF4241 domain-containing protein n=1 Tax=Nannocystis pusilla TaxID=889268 RepID=A0ABS7TXC2_9BACT|nr:DUF4241 domain-containing protein [Nannocystis pusilla]MBZ5712902.1 DUF4241 domain-containing protein [Nannocystis pusilla]
MTSPRHALPLAFVPLRTAHLAGKKAAGVKEVVSAGALVITSGKLVACDALMQPERAPFLRPLPAGTYPVYLYVARSGSAIGFAELRLRDTAVVRFELATIPGQDAATLGERESFVYPVGTGLGSFADAAAIERLRAADAALQAADPRANDYDSRLRDELARHGGLWTDHRPDPHAADNVIVFRSGDGDGSYPTWFGLDDAGEVACVVTSFRVFKEPETPEQKLRKVADVFAPLIAAIDRDIGATLKARGFAGPEAAYKVKSDEGELKLNYARDGLCFEVQAWSRGPYLGSAHFRWTRVRTTLDVGNEHRKAGVPLALESALAVGDRAYGHSAKIGATYAEHWDALERAVLHYLPVKPARPKKN